jgi:predicted metal-binding protein
MIISINPLEIPLDIDSQRLCCKAYPNHPKGCPNYGMKKGCPPNVSPLKEILDFNKEIFLIYTEFDIGNHAERMKKLHPDWSNRQIYCCLYWQPKARKVQRQEEERCRKEMGIEVILTSPEAMKVNVTSLMKKVGVDLEWPPKKTTRIVSLGGYKN